MGRDEKIAQIVEMRKLAFEALAPILHRALQEGRR